MQQFQEEFAIQSHGSGLIEFSQNVHDAVARSGISNGLLTLFCQHTSASLIIQENADPDVISDLSDFFSTLVKEDARLYRHSSEGPDDMPAHIRAALTQTSLSIPIRANRLTLGVWQGVYLFEHRRQPHRRRISVHIIGT